MMLNKGELDGKRILSEKAVAEMTRTQTGDLKTGFVDGMGFGYGWAVVKEPKGVTEMLSPGTLRPRRGVRHPGLDRPDARTCS